MLMTYASSSSNALKSLLCFLRDCDQRVEVVMRAQWPSGFVSLPANATKLVSQDLSKVGLKAISTAPNSHVCLKLITSSIIC